MKTVLTLFLAVLSFVSCKEKQESITEETEKEIITPDSKYSCAPVVSDTLWYTSDNKAPIFEGLDVVNYPITTKREAAQRYFNQGLILAYGFNHAEAARSFYYATKLDPQCAMCYWGYAYVLGPNYNAGMEVC